MTEPAEEQPRRDTIARQVQCLSGGAQDDSQSPFGDTAATPAVDTATNQTNRNTENR